MSTQNRTPFYPYFEIIILQVISNIKVDTWIHLLWCRHQNEPYFLWPIYKCLVKNKETSYHNCITDGYLITPANKLNSSTRSFNYDSEILTLDLNKLKPHKGFLQSSNCPCGEQKSGSESIFPPVSTPLPSTPQLSGLYTIYVFLFWLYLEIWSMRSDLPVLIH